MPEPTHHSYLLRLWREHAGAPLRATLIPVAQPEAPRHFATLDHLCVFLRAQAGERPCMTGDRDTAYCTPSESS